MLDFHYVLRHKALEPSRTQIIKPYFFACFFFLLLQLGHSIVLLHLLAFLVLFLCSDRLLSIQPRKIIAPHDGVKMLGLLISCC